MTCSPINSAARLANGTSCSSKRDACGLPSTSRPISTAIDNFSFIILTIVRDTHAAARAQSAAREHNKNNNEKQQLFVFSIIGVVLAVVDFENEPRRTTAGILAGAATLSSCSQQLFYGR